jgi:hypothetical protein
VTCPVYRIPAGWDRFICPWLIKWSKAYDNAWSVAQYQAFDALD